MSSKEKNRNKNKHVRFYHLAELSKIIKTDFFLKTSQDRFFSNVVIKPISDLHERRHFCLKLKDSLQFKQTFKLVNQKEIQY